MERPNAGDPYPLLNGSSMTKRIRVFVVLVALSASILVYAIHTSWLLWTLLGILLVVGALAYLSAPSGTGHVLDNLVSLILTSVLLVVLGCSVQKLMDRSAARPKIPAELPTTLDATQP
jgi:predicted neutral ceramidase superfamily lipid hydrolase